jgi:hypothetical protein
MPPDGYFCVTFEKGMVQGYQNPGTVQKTNPILWIQEKAERTKGSEDQPESNGKQEDLNF